MSDASLNQAEADALLAIEKRRAQSTEWDYPGLGGRVTAPLVSADGR